jgi:hypothetical protein
MSEIIEAALSTTLPAAILGLSMAAQAVPVWPAQTVASAPVEVSTPSVACLGQQSLDLPDNSGPRFNALQTEQEPLLQRLQLRSAPMLPHSAEAVAIHAAALSRNSILALETAEMIRFRRSLVGREAHMNSASRRARVLASETARLRRPSRTEAAHGSQRSAGAELPIAEQLRRRIGLRFLESSSIAIARRQAQASREALPGANGWSMAHAEALDPAPGRWFPWYQPPLLSETAIVLLEGYSPRPLRCPVLLHWEPIEQPDCPEIVPPGPSIPIRSVYIVVPDVVVTRLSNSLEIPCAGLTLTHDADSHSWAAELMLAGPDAIGLLEPDGDAPVVLAVHVNGFDWHVIVDRWSEAVKFGSRGIRLTTRGLSAELCSPWSQPIVGTNASAQTVQQLFEALLPFGWSINWQAGVSPWTVPIGAWSWSGAAALPTIHAATQALGLSIRPARTARQLEIICRYPVNPWDFENATPDLVVPLSAVTYYERTAPVATQANTVFVHGAEPGGITCQVTRSGTAGDLVGETISHPLVTDIDAARVAGARALARQHESPEWSAIAIPLGGDFPLVSTGDLLELSAGAQGNRAIASGVTVQVRPASRGLSVRQAISLSEDTPNELRRFRELVPGSPTYLSEVISVDGNTSLVELLTGDRLRVQGTDSPGQMVYISSGRIIGQAPTLPAFQITV